jgi:hypothetical protein
MHTMDPTGTLVAGSNSENQIPTFASAYGSLICRLHPSSATTSSIVGCQNQPSIAFCPPCMSVIIPSHNPRQLGQYLGAFQ